ncbi:hypothetical protein GmRootV118_25540 [Variovorax sp. V118]|uniref:hypothetical protein n=1 Tax=Variovorax sp. V118 TaxID=3065954 RepID=UPI0034E8CA80
MASAFLRSKVCAACVALMAVAACGGGSGGGGGGSFFPIGGTPAPAEPAGPADPTPQEPADAGFAVKVMDGALRNAVVFLDKNNNGLLDTDEPSARTDAEGNATLQIAPADRGTAPVVALVGTDAVDAQSGAVTTAYVLKAPADKAQLVTPFTTLINQLVENTGATSEQAEANLREQLGLANDLFADYSTDHPNASMATTLVRIAQKLSVQLAGQVGMPDGLGGNISAGDIAKETQNMLLDRLLGLRFGFSTSFAKTSCAGGPAVDTCQGYIDSLSTYYVTDARESQLNKPLALFAAVTASKSIAAAPAVTEPDAPAPAGILDFLTLTNTTNWSRRLLLSTTEEVTPVNGIVRFRDFRNSSTNGTLATWSYGGSPARQNDLHWSGSAWVACPVGFQSTSTVRDARSVSTSDYCAGANTGVSKRTSVDISGQPMSVVVAGIKTYPYTSSGPYGQSYANWGPDLPLTEIITTLSPFTFPPGSTLYYQGALDLSNAPGYDAIEANKLNVAAADVAAGGDSRLDPTIACLVSTAPGTPASTLDEVIARSPGRACFHAPGPLAGTAFPSGDRNEGWGGTTTNLGTLGNAPLGTTATATGYYTTNTLVRVSFAGGASKVVTFYECKQRAVNGSARNCDVVGTGSYTITQMGDARVMRFGSVPGQHTFLGSDRVLIERDGAVFVGSQGKAVAKKQIRMNLKAANAMFEAFTTLGYVGLSQITP